MKKFISIIISAVMVMSIFTSLPTTSFAAKKKAGKVSLKKSSATLKITKKNGKKVYGTTNIKVKKLKGVKIKSTTYKSSNKKIASVNKDGKVKAKSAGAAIITVKVKYKFKKRTYNKKLLFFATVKNSIKKSKPANEATSAPVTTEAVEYSAPFDTKPAYESNTTAPWVSESETQAATDPVSTNEPAPTNPEATEDIIAPTGGDDYIPMPTNDIQGDTGHCTDNDIQGDTSHCTDLDNPGEKDPDWTGVTKPDGSPYYEYYESQPYTNDDIQGDTGHCTDLDNPGETDPNWTGVTKPDGSPYYEMYTTAPATEEETKEQTFNDKLSAFSNKLYAMCSEDLEENYVMSPISVYMALAMLYHAGDETVRNDIKDFIGMDDSDLAQTGTLFTNLVSHYETYSWETGEDIEEACLDLSNSIWCDTNIKMDSEELKKLAQVLYVDAFNTTFYDDNAAANQEIQKFVCEKTRGLINQDFQLDPTTLFALINTIYFKDVWDLEGVDKLYSEEMAFKTENGDVYREFLYGDYVLGQVQETDSSYYFYTRTKHGYKIKFVVPKDGYTLKEAMSDDNLNKVNSQTNFKSCENGKYHLTQCIFPSFVVRSHTELSEVFKSNDVLKNAFGVFTSPLTEDKSQPLTVEKIVHKAVLDVNKEGVEGAAVTIVQVAAGCAEGEEEDPYVYHQFLINKNFGFIVTDYNDVILFEGQVIE